MGRQSSIDRLPPEIRTAISDLRREGRTIDEILAHLRTLVEEAPSRSALGRHVQGLDELAEDLHRSRAIAEALVARHGDDSPSRAAQANIELLHSAILKLFLPRPDGSVPDIGSKEAMALSIALEKLAAARKRDAEYVAQIRKELAAEAAKAVERANDKSGRKIDAGTLEMIRREIYGITA